MKIKNWILAFAASLPLTIALGFSNTAVAGFVDCEGLGVDNHIDGQIDCISTTDNVNDEGANGIVNDESGDGAATFDPLFGGTEAWMELPLWNDGGVGGSYGCITGTDWLCNDEGADLGSGSWSINTVVWDMYDEVMLFFKDGNHGQTAVRIGPAGFSDVGGYVTDNFGAGVQMFNCGWFGGPTCYGGDFANMIPNNTSPDVISHVNLWVRGESMDVAEPGTLALLGIGLLGFGLRRRRKAV